MHHSLLSRVEGCLLGMVLGEFLGRSPGPETPFTPTDWTTLPLHWSPLVLASIQAWTTFPRLDATTPWEIPGFDTAPDANPDSWPLLLLPLALYYHDDLGQQRQALIPAFEQWAVPTGDRHWLVLWAYAIAAALKQQLDPHHFCSQAQAYSRVVLGDEDPTALLRDLHQIEQDGLGTGLAEIPSTWQRSPLPTLAIALSAFLQTPDHWHLVVNRSLAWGRALSPDGSLAGLGAIAGALTGAYTSHVGIASTDQSLPAIAQSRVLRTAIHELAAAFLATWSGCYDPTAIAPTAAVTAPWVMRSSSQF